MKIIYLVTMEHVINSPTPLFPAKMTLLQSLVKLTREMERKFIISFWGIEMELIAFRREVFHITLLIGIGCKR